MATYGYYQSKAYPTRFYSTVVSQPLYRTYFRSRDVSRYPSMYVITSTISANYRTIDPSIWPYITICSNPVVGKSTTNSPIIYQSPYVTGKGKISKSGAKGKAQYTTVMQMWAPWMKVNKFKVGNPKTGKAPFLVTNWTYRGGNFSVQAKALSTYSLTGKLSSRFQVPTMTQPIKGEASARGSVVSAHAD